MSAFAGFQLTEEIYSAGSTRVCRALRLADRQPVILKILSGEDIKADAFAQYRREYELTRSLAEVVGVIGVIGLENVQDTLMIVEEDIGGESLARILAAAEVRLDDALSLAVRLAHALGEIHRHHIIHKDINPANIVWNRSTDELRVIDFGIASQLSHERQEFRSVNQLEGSLPYISPEQTGRVNRTLDYRSDLYSLGISLYQLLTGTLPFTPRQGIELVHAHIALTPPPPHKLNPRIPEPLSAIVMRLISKMADDRYQSAWGLEHDLKRCLDELRYTGQVSNFRLALNDPSIHFHIPQKLYGRAAEIDAIVAAFDRCAAGSRELLLVKGSAGAGKTALVREVHKPLTEKRGSFVAGKFDQYQRDIPFYAWTQACEQFCELLLKEDDATLAAWRDRIAAGLGTLGKVVAEIVPSIETILGPQPAVPPLSGEQAQNRLNYAFGNFLTAICGHDHPLVVFIDDWQWADAGSLALLRSLLDNPELGHLLLIGAFRDNEVREAHPFALTLAAIERSRATVATIAVGGLRQEDVRQLVADALGAPPETASLARLVFDKTRGNAFFVVQLLADLYDKSLIVFDAAQRRWTWRADEIELHAVADNVVDLMTEHIRQLTDTTQHALVHAACIGDRFDLTTLATILGTPAYEVADALDEALREGVLLPIGLGYRIAGQRGSTANAHYQFIHDRVRQAAYGMLDTAAAERSHYDIARIWLAEFDAAEQEARIFDIANQINAGRRHAGDGIGRRELLSINLHAGKRAKHATAYRSALHYFQAALGAFVADDWNDDPHTAAELHILAAEVAFLSKDYPVMEGCIETYLAHVAAPLERVKAYKVRLQACVAQNRLAEAVDVGLHALALLGVVLPRKPNPLQVMAGLMKTKFALRSKSLADLRALPAMAEPTRLAAMDLLGLTLPPAYWSAPDLMALIVFQMVRESVAHGYSPNAGYGYSWWGITECAMLGNIEAGCTFGDFAIELAREHDLSLQQPLFFSGWIIRKFKHPLRSTLPVLEQTYAVALEKGDFEYASYARNNYIQALFNTGYDLTLLLPEAERAHADLQRFQVGSSLYWHNICWQTAINFVAPGDDPQALIGTAYDENLSQPQHLKANDVSSLFLLYFHKLLLSCFFGRRREAVDNAARARQYLKGGVGMHAFVLFHVYESLALLVDIDDKDFLARRHILRTVAANQKKLKHWADHAPTNYRHHWLLVEAERTRARELTDLALAYFDEAIDQARENGFVHEEALAYELAARCHRQRRQDRMGAYYLRQALQVYERWGATAKSAQLVALNPELRLTQSLATDLPRTGTTFHGTSGNLQAHAFDVLAITAASQAISGEIVLDKLVTTLLKIVVEHSGAQKASLILDHDGRLTVEARAVAGHTLDIAVGSTPIDGGDSLPQSVIQYVARTAKSLVIDDARQEAWYSRDPYVARERPLSVLCEPIVRQGVLTGMLYMENNLTAGAFTAERLELLRLIASQAAISIENATLYRSLERKVEERTQKLQDSLQTQERLNTELQASAHQLAEAHAQLRIANAQLQQQADTDGLTGLANRRAFNDRLRYELDRCAREQQPLTLILCDLDNFKRYNDTYGHVAGDDCLKAAARAFLSVFTRATDLVARYGGEEFVVLLPATAGPQGAALGEAMCAAVAALTMPHSGNGDYGIVTISAGCYSFVPDGSTNPEAHLEHADAALYQAKQAGRNRLVCVG